MAIDSIIKRASCWCVGLPWAGYFPAADSSVTTDDRMVCANEYALPPWTEADSFTDTSSGWVNEENAYDYDTATYAENSIDTLFTELELHFSSPVETNKFRLMAQGYEDPDTHNPDLKVYLYWGGQWNLAWDGEITKDEWFYYPAGDTPSSSTITVSKAKVISNDSVYGYIRLYELHLLNLSLVSVTARPLVGGSLAQPVTSFGGALIR